MKNENMKKKHAWISNLSSHIFKSKITRMKIKTTQLTELHVYQILIANTAPHESRARASDVQE